MITSWLRQPDSHFAGWLRFYFSTTNSDLNYEKIMQWPGPGHYFHWDIQPQAVHGCVEWLRLGS